jgi:hypothetical protein
MIGWGLVFIAAIVAVMVLFGAGLFWAFFGFLSESESEDVGFPSRRDPYFRDHDE